MTLEDGTIVTPDMVSEKPAISNAFELVFLPDAKYIDSFVNENTRFHEIIQSLQPERVYNASLVYHAAPMSVLSNAVYREQFLYQFDKVAVKHIIDNSEVNLEEYARPKAHQHTQVVSSICPQITPLATVDFTSINADRVTRF